MRKLQENPNDNAAITQMENSQKEVRIVLHFVLQKDCITIRMELHSQNGFFQMSSWAASKFTPGKFLGSTGANILSAKELQSGGTQAWAKKVCDWLRELSLNFSVPGGKRSE